MSYDISFKVKVEGVNAYVPVGNCCANATWNLGEMIRASTGLTWDNEENNGLVKDVIPFIEKGASELRNNPSKYKEYECENGWGTVSGCLRFFKDILDAWDDFCTDSWTEELIDVVTFWIE